MINDDDYTHTHSWSMWEKSYLNVESRLRNIIHKSNRYLSIDYNKRRLRVIGIVKRIKSYRNTLIMLGYKWGCRLIGYTRNNVPVNGIYSDEIANFIVHTKDVVG